MAEREDHLRKALADREERRNRVRPRVTMSWQGAEFPAVEEDNR